MRDAFFFLIIAMFWNLENYYDPFDDPATADGDFTPAGSYHWTYTKFAKKRDDIAKTIISLRDFYGTYPAVIGLAEVENRFVLRELVQKTPLAALEYEVIHRDSPDRRGIDVGLLYRKRDFRPLAVRSIYLKVPRSAAASPAAVAPDSAVADSLLATRSILYVKGILYSADTLHLLVNHWPSKRGEAVIANRNRMTASETVKHFVDSLLVKNSKAKILVMGDLNDTAESEAVSNLNNLTNLAGGAVKSGEVPGTYKYKESWDIIDHLLVSPALAGEPYFPQMGIFAGKLLVEDSIYLGVKPFRTFTGPRYNGGISDHLPVLLLSGSAGR